MKKIIAIVGDAAIEPNSEKERIAYEIGKALIDNGYRIQTGGLRGVMKAACRGASESPNHKDGDIIGLLPSFNHEQANEYVDIPITTGLDIMRNALVASAEAVIAIGGGAGTLSEIALAWSLKRMVICVSGVDGWSDKLAGTRIDNRVRYENIEDDRVYKVSTPEEVIDILKERLDMYDTVYQGIKTE